MIKHVEKPEKISVCHLCGGKGIVEGEKESQTCPQCLGSGRVLVSCEMRLDIKPFVVRKD